MKLNCVRVICYARALPGPTPIYTPMYGLPLSQSDRRTLSVCRSVYNNYQLLHQYHRILAAYSIQEERARKLILCGTDTITVLSYG